MKIRPFSLAFRTAFACSALLAAWLVPVATAIAAPAPDHWVGTWATADVDRPNPNGLFGGADTTLRQIVHVSLGGSLVRVELSNEFGTEPLTIGAVHIARSGKEGEIILATANALTFAGAKSVTIPPGERVISDPVSLALPPLSDLTISIFLPAQKISHLTQHGAAFQTNYIVPGNVVGAASLGAAASKQKKVDASWYFLKSVDVSAPAKAGAVVTLGDSITDGTASTRDANNRWPDVLARRLQADKKTADIGVLNAGIGGNRVLHDGNGPNALSRFDRDVLAQSGVKYLIVLESINDIGAAYNPENPRDVVTAEDLIAGLTQMIERAHAHGIKVFGATLTPYVGAKYSSPQGEKVREAVNQWIRTAKAYDGVIDFEAVTRDPAHPEMFIPAFNKGDHLHPDDAGYDAMGNSIDLKLFTEK